MAARRSLFSHSASRHQNLLRSCGRGHSPSAASVGPPESGSAGGSSRWGRILRSRTTRPPIIIMVAVWSSYYRAAFGIFRFGALPSFTFPLVSGPSSGIFKTLMLVENYEKY
ncbi:hypothetical protein E2C01_003703 [Portunus trituberculatus]|uniref:Uncharacterized protein n=1 Tax=Portunus trituberculatus TaxID=210409 RepID=A0A5B7CNE4_PORTR|nr:hypothetical protein [Portunus trituberculatus]